MPRKMFGSCFTQGNDFFEISIDGISARCCHDGKSKYEPFSYNKEEKIVMFKITNDKDVTLDIFCLESGCWLDENLQLAAEFEQGKVYFTTTHENYMNNYEFWFVQGEKFTEIGGFEAPFESTLDFEIVGGQLKICQKSTKVLNLSNL